MTSSELIARARRALEDPPYVEMAKAAIQELIDRNIEWYQCDRCSLHVGGDVAYFVGDSAGEEDELHWKLYELHPDGVLCQGCTNVVAGSFGL